MQADLQQIAAKLRGLALEAIFAGGSGHPGGSLSLGEIMAALYFEAANIDANDPKNPKRDRVVLSKGHACPILYAALCLYYQGTIAFIAPYRQFPSGASGYEGNPRR